MLVLCSEGNGHRAALHAATSVFEPNIVDHLTNRKQTNRTEHMNQIQKHTDMNY